jgi:hypothetical protein
MACSAKVELPLEGVQDSYVQQHILGLHLDAAGGWCYWYDQYC